MFFLNLDFFETCFRLILKIIGQGQNDDWLDQGGRWPIEKPVSESDEGIWREERD